MIKQTITYTDFDDNEKTEELNFHISKSDVTDDMDLADDFTAVGRMLRSKEENDTLSMAEITSVLDLVKRLVRLSYGVRSTTEDGRQKFVKNEKVWEDFRYSAIYDAMLFGMFEDTTKAVAFMSGVLPKALFEEAMAEQAAIEAGNGPKAPQDHLPKAVPAPTQEVKLDTPEQVPFEGSVEATSVVSVLEELTDDQLRERVAGRQVSDLSVDEMKQVLRRGIPLEG